MMLPKSFLLVFQALTVLSQTITEIKQIPIYSDLAACAVYPVRQVFYTMRALNCPQKIPQSIASCFCLKKANVSNFSFSVSTSITIACTNEPEVEFTSAMEVYSSYCEEGLAGLVTTSLSTSEATNTGGINSSESTETNSKLGISLRWRQKAYVVGFRHTFVD